jgi:tRNA A37 threonylcarbamoyladenosine biosynthesis protein TsaE
LKRAAECIEWCDRGLALNPGDKILLQLRKESDELQKTTERDERKKAAKEKKQKKEEQVNPLRRG